MQMRMSSLVDTHAVEVERRFEELKARTKALEMASGRVERSPFLMFRANLLTALVKKLSADTNKETPDNSSEGGKRCRP